MCLSCIYRGRPCEPLLQLYVYITKDRVVQLCLRPILRRRNLKTEVSLWKRIKCFPSALHRRNLKTPQSPVILDLYLKKKKKSGKEITWSSWGHRFEKPSFSKCFLSTWKRKTGVFKFLRFDERFRKALFSWRISLDGRPNRRNKAAFSNSSTQRRVDVA